MLYKFSIHKVEKEAFTVVNGTLDIEIDLKHSALEVGGFIYLIPGKIHKLKAVNNHPVRVLYFSFPAFNPEDMHFI